MPFILCSSIIILCLVSCTLNSSKDIAFSAPYLTTGFGGAIYLEENTASKSLKLLGAESEKSKPLHNCFVLNIWH